MTSIALIRDLFAHQAWADIELLRAAAAQANSSSDDKLKATLEHIVLVQRVFTAILEGAEFDFERESQPASSLTALQQRFASSHSDQLAYVSRLSPEALDRVVPNPRIPDLKGTVADVLMQVVLHSQNHRGQCLTRLRELTGKAPTLDYILWVKLGRPEYERAAGASQ